MFVFYQKQANETTISNLHTEIDTLKKITTNPVQIQGDLGKGGNSDVITLKQELSEQIEQLQSELEVSQVELDCLHK